MGEEKVDVLETIMRAMHDENNSLTEELFAKYQERFGDDPAFVNLKAQFYIQMDRPDAAIKTIEPLSGANREADLLVTLGRAYGSMGMPESEEACYQRAMKCEKYKVSIIVPVYKVELFLERCLDSIAAQTYRRWEAVLVDDGSPDDCGAICDAYAEKDNRFSVIHQENQGVAAARNAGLAAAVGDFIAFTDSDDWIEPNFIFDLLKRAIAFNLDVVECNFKIVDDKNSYTSAKGNFAIESLFETISRRILTDTNVVWNEIYRAACVKNQVFPLKRKYDDLFFIYPALLSAKRFGFLDAPLYNYYQNMNSEVHQDFSFRSLDAVEGYYRRMKRMETVSSALYTLSVGIFLKYFFSYLSHSLTLTNEAERKKCEEKLVEYAQKCGILLVPNSEKAFPERFFQIESQIISFCLKEKPSSLLIVGTHTVHYGKLLHRIFDLMGTPISLGQIEFDANSRGTSGVFSDSFPAKSLAAPSELKRYECVLVTDIFEELELETAKHILRNVLSRANKSVTCVMGLLQNRTADQEQLELYRRYHPAAFCDFDFSYCLPTFPQNVVQFYTFYPNLHFPSINQMENKPVPCAAFDKKLKIAYLLPHKNLTGGLKALLEQMRHLHRHGHKVYAVYKNRLEEKENTTAVPQWSNLDVEKELSGQIVLQNDQQYQDALADFDIVMVGFVSQLVDFMQPYRVPVVYWEQGYEYLYGDYKELLESNNQVLQSFRSIYKAPVHYLAVSPQVQKILKSRYGIQAVAIDNGIDLDFYKPKAHKEFSGTILLVGNPTLPFKGFNFALKVLNRVWEMGYRFQVNWACQVMPEVSHIEFPLQCFVMQPQDTLAKLYREADVFLFTSLYESFPLPPFEAMASGVPVVAADCGGIGSYAKPGQNILLFDQMDVDSASGAIIALLQHEKIRRTLAENGRKTAEEYTFERVTSDLEKYFYFIIKEHESK